MAVTHFATDVDFHLNQLRQARFETVAALPPPTGANAGLLVRYAADGQLYASTGTAWSTVAAPGGFVHTQLVPQAVITVTHDLGYRPAVSMYSPDYGVQYAEYQTQHLGIDTVRVSMDTPHACVLVMS
jgi:hypothetical protein